MCHRVSEERAWQCECGYEFGQPVDKVIELLRDQRTNARIMLVFSILAMAAAVALLIFGPFFSIWLLGGGIAWTGRNLRKLLITRASLKQLADRKLPEAKLLKG